MSGFTDVYELLGGRASWTVLGLPTEGERGDEGRIAALARRPPTLAVDATIADVAALGDVERVAVVVGCDDVVVGALERAALDLAPDTPVRDVMIPAPSTIRPDLRVDEVTRRFEKDGLEQVLVTTAYGVLIGLVTADDLRDG